MENKESLNYEFKYARKVQETNYIPPIDLYQTLHSSLKNNVWSAYLGRVYYQAEVNSKVRTVESLNDGLNYDFGTLKKIDAVKIVNGKEVDNYNYIHNYEYNKDTDSYEIYYEPADRIEESGVVATEMDLLLHEGYRYLGWDYIDNPNYQAILTDNEITEFFKDNFIFLNIDYSAIYKFSIKEKIRSVQNYKLARMLANSRYMYYVAGYVFDKNFKVFDIYSVGNLDKYDYCGFNIFNLRKDISIEGSEIPSFMVDDALKEICYENPASASANSLNSSYYQSDATNSASKYTIMLKDTYQMYVSNLLKSFLYYDCSEYTYNSIADNMYNYSANKYLIQCSNQSIDEIKLYDKVTKSPISLKAYGDFSSFNYNFETDTWKYSYDFKENPLYNERITILVDNVANQYYIKDFRRGHIICDIKEAFSLSIDRKFFDVPFVLMIKTKNGEYRSLLAIYKDSKVDNLDDNSGYLLKSLDFEIIANLSSNIISTSSSDISEGIDYSYNGILEDLYEYQEISIIPYGASDTFVYNNENPFRNKTVLIKRCSLGSFIIEDKEGNSLSALARRTIFKNSQFDVDKILETIYRIETNVEIELLSATSFTFIVKDSSVVSCINSGDKVVYKGNSYTVGAVDGNSLKIIEDYIPGIPMSGEATIYTKNSLSQELKIDNGDYDIEENLVCSFDADYNLRDYTCNVDLYKLYPAKSFKGYINGDFWEYSDEVTPQFLTKEDDVLFYEENTPYNVLMKDIVVSFVSTSVSFIWNNESTLGEKCNSFLKNALSDRYLNRINEIFTFYIRKSSSFATRDIGKNYYSQSFNAYNNPENIVKYIQLGNEGHKSSKMAAFLRQKENIRSTVYSSSGSPEVSIYNDRTLNNDGMSAQAIYNDRPNLSNTLYISSLDNPILDIQLSPLNSLTNVNIDGKEIDLVNVVLSKSEFSANLEIISKYCTMGDKTTIKYFSFENGVFRNHLLTCFLSEALIDLSNPYFLGLLKKFSGIQKLDEETILEGDIEVTDNTTGDLINMSVETALYTLAKGIFGSAELNKQSNIYDIFFFFEDILYRLSLERKGDKLVTLKSDYEPCLVSYYSKDFNFKEDSYKIFCKDESKITPVHTEIENTFYEGNFEEYGYKLYDIKYEDVEGLDTLCPLHDYWPYNRYYSIDDLGKNTLKERFQLYSAEELLKALEKSKLFSINTINYNNMSALTTDSDINPLLISKASYYITDKGKESFTSKSLKEWSSDLTASSANDVKKKLNLIREFFLDKDVNVANKFTLDSNLKFEYYNFIASGRALKNTKYNVISIESPVWPFFDKYLYEGVTLTETEDAEITDLLDDWNNSISHLLKNKQYTVCYIESSNKYFKNLFISKGKKYQTVDTKNKKTNVISLETSGAESSDTILAYSDLIDRNTYKAEYENVAFSKEYKFNNPIRGITDDNELIASETLLYKSANQLLKNKEGLKEELVNSKPVKEHILKVSPMINEEIEYYKNNLLIKGTIKKGDTLTINTDVSIKGVVNDSNFNSVKVAVLEDPLTDVSITKDTNAFEPILWCKVIINGKTMLFILESETAHLIEEDGDLYVTAPLDEGLIDLVSDLKDAQLSVTSIANTIIVSDEYFRSLSFNIYYDDILEELAIQAENTVLTDVAELPLETPEQFLTYDRGDYIYNAETGDCLPKDNFFISKVNLEDHTMVGNGIDYRAPDGKAIFIDSCRSVKDQKFTTVNGRPFIYNNAYNVAGQEPEENYTHENELTEGYYWRKLDLLKYVRKLPSGKLVDDIRDSLNQYLEEIIVFLQDKDKELSKLEKSKTELKNDKSNFNNTLKAQLEVAKVTRQNELNKLDEILEEKAILEKELRIFNEIDAGEDEYESTIERYIRLKKEFDDLFESLDKGNTLEVLEDLGYKDGLSFKNLSSAINYCEVRTSDEAKNNIINSYNTLDTSINYSLIQTAIDSRKDTLEQDMYEAYNELGDPEALRSIFPVDNLDSFINYGDSHRDIVENHEGLAAIGSLFTVPTLDAQGYHSPVFFNFILRNLCIAYGSSASIHTGPLIQAVKETLNSNVVENITITSSYFREYGMFNNDYTAYRHYASIARDIKDVYNNFKTSADFNKVYKELIGKNFENLDSSFSAAAFSNGSKTVSEIKSFKDLRSLSIDNIESYLLSLYKEELRAALESRIKETIIDSGRLGPHTIGYALAEIFDNHVSSGSPLTNFNLKYNIKSWLGYTRTYSGLWYSKLLPVARNLAYREGTKSIRAIEQVSLNYFYEFANELIRNVVNSFIIAASGQPDRMFNAVDNSNNIPLRNMLNSIKNITEDFNRNSYDLTLNSSDELVVPGTAELSVDGTIEIQPIVGTKEPETFLDKVIYDSVTAKFDKIEADVELFNKSKTYLTELRAVNSQLTAAKAGLDIACMDLQTVTEEMHNVIKKFGDTTKLTEDFTNALEISYALSYIDMAGSIPAIDTHIEESWYKVDELNSSKLVLTTEGDAALLRNMKLVNEALKSENSPFFILASVNENIDNTKNTIETTEAEIYDLSQKITDIHGKIIKNRELISNLESGEFGIYTYAQFLAKGYTYDQEARIAKLPCPVKIAPKVLRDEYDVEFCMDTGIQEITFEGKDFDIFAKERTTALSMYQLYLEIILSALNKTVNLSFIADERLTIRGNSVPAISLWNDKGLAIISGNGVFSVESDYLYDVDNLKYSQKWTAANMDPALYVDDDVTSSKGMNIIINDDVYTGQKENQRHLFYNVVDVDADGENMFLLASTKTRVEISRIFEAINQSYASLGGQTKIDPEDILNSGNYSDDNVPMILWSTDGGKTLKYYVLKEYKGCNPKLALAVDNYLLVQLLERATNKYKVIAYDLTQEQGADIIYQGPIEIEITEEMAASFYEKMNSGVNLAKFDNIIYDIENAQALLNAKTQSLLSKDIPINSITDNSIICDVPVIKKAVKDLEAFFIIKTDSPIEDPTMFVEKDFSRLNTTSYNLLRNNILEKVDSVNDANGLIIPRVLQDEDNPIPLFIGQNDGDAYYDENTHFINYYTDNCTPLENIHGQQIKVLVTKDIYTDENYSVGLGILEGYYKGAANAYVFKNFEIGKYFEKDISIPAECISYDLDEDSDLIKIKIDDSFNLTDTIKNISGAEKYVISKDNYYRMSSTPEIQELYDYTVKLDRDIVKNQNDITSADLEATGFTDIQSYLLGQRFSFVEIESDYEPKYGYLYDTYNKCYLYAKNQEFEEGSNGQIEYIGSDFFLYKLDYSGSIIMDRMLHKVELPKLENKEIDNTKVQRIISDEIICSVYLHEKGYGASTIYNWKRSLQDGSDNILKIGKNYNAVEPDFLPWSIDCLAFDETNTVKNELGEDIVICNEDGKDLIFDGNTIPLKKMQYKSYFELLKNLNLEIIESKLFDSVNLERKDGLKINLNKIDDNKFSIEDDLPNGSYIFYILTKSSVALSVSNFDNYTAFVDITSDINNYEPDRVYTTNIKSPIIESEERILYFNSSTLKQEDYIEECFSNFGYTQDLWYNKAGNAVYCCDERGIPYSLNTDSNDRYYLDRMTSFSQTSLVQSLGLSETNSVSTLDQSSLDKLFLTNTAGNLLGIDIKIFAVRDKNSLSLYDVNNISSFFENSEAKDLILIDTKKSMNLYNVSLRYNKDNLLADNTNGIIQSFSYGNLEFDEIALFNNSHLIVGYILLDESKKIDMDSCLCSLVIASE